MTLLSDPASPVALPAGYFDGLSARRHPVIVSMAGGIVSIEGGGVDRHEPLSSVRIDQALGSAPRIIRLADGAFCEVPDHEGFQRLLMSQGVAPDVISQWETSWRWIAVAVAVFFAMLYVTYRFGIPIVAEAAAYRIPSVATEKLSTQVLEFLDGELLTPSELPQARRDDLVAQFQRLQMPASSRGMSYRIHFRKSELLGPNALALPSGLIVVTDELVALARDDREILGVVAHEAGHVDRRHGLRQMLQSSIVGLLVAWYIGDVSTIAAAAPTALIEAKYSRDLEREADAYAAELLRANDVDTRHLADLLRRIDETAGQSPGAWRYLSSHPATADRLEQLQSAGTP